MLDIVVELKVSLEWRLVVVGIEIGPGLELELGAEAIVDEAHGCHQETVGLAAEVELELEEAEIEVEVELEAALEVGFEF